MGSSGTVIAYPEDEIENAESVEALAHWMHSAPGGWDGSQVLSTRCSSKSLDRLARGLRPRVSHADPRLTAYHVVVREPPYSTPVVLGYESKTQTRLFPSGDLVSLDVPSPSCRDELSDSEAWICDLVEDPVCRRAPWELCPPATKGVIEILNAPFPPTLAGDTSRFGYGVDSVNVRCTKNHPTERFGMPTEEELLEGILQAHGIRAKTDEKRSRYLPAIELLGGLMQAARVFSSSAFAVLKAFLREGPRGECTAGDPLTFEGVRKRAAQDLSLTNKLTPIIARLLEGVPPLARSVAKRRHGVKENDVPADADQQIRAIIKEFLEKGMLLRQWRLPKCPHCQGKYWVGHVPLNPPLPCPGCSRPVSLKDSVALGWRLNELIPPAIQEGIIPVVFTGRFLRGLTTRGFMWLPGVKCVAEDTETDLDILACCDGHLAAAECEFRKEAAASSEMWSKLASKLERCISIARRVGVSVFAVASLHPEYPRSFQEKVRKAAGNELSVLFLGRTDLTSGHRYESRHGVMTRLSLHDVLPRVRSPKKRTTRRPITLTARELGCQIRISR